MQPLESATPPLELVEEAAFRFEQLGGTLGNPDTQTHPALQPATIRTRWKAHFRLSADKEQALALALRTFPPCGAEFLHLIGGRLMPPTEKQNREFALVLIRTVCRRIQLINEEITAIGTALSQDRLSAREALDLVEGFAPGCADVVFMSLFEGATPEQLKGAGAKAAKAAA